MIQLLESITLFHPLKRRYAVYRYLSKGGGEEEGEGEGEGGEDLEWGVMSRSGLIDIAMMTIKSGLVSGKIFSSIDKARHRLQVLVNSAKRRGFIEGNYQIDFTANQEWEAMNNNLKKREQSIKDAENKSREGKELSQNQNYYLLEIQSY